MLVAGKRPQRGTGNATSLATLTTVPRSLLWVTDEASGAHFLVDTGATVSIVPLTPHDAQDKLAYDLLAANGTPIATYGTRPLDLTLAPRTRFTWPFVVADVRQAILGMDFLSAHDVLVDSKRRQLIHKPSNTRIQAAPCPGQAPVISHLQTESPFTWLLRYSSHASLHLAPTQARGSMA